MKKVAFLLFILIPSFPLLNFSYINPVELTGIPDKKVEIFPPIEPFNTGFLKVSDFHEMYYEQSGNPKGKPVFVVHGGPGGGTKPVMRRFFNPKKFRIILFDQRGSGKSKPYAEVAENTSRLLVEDMEKLRNHLKLDKVFLFGGSWGSTLSLLYAETYPNNVSGMLLRGIWTGTKDEIDHFYHGGAGLYFPEAYQRLLKSLPDPLKRPLPDYLYKLIQDSNGSLRDKYVKEWARYEIKISGINISDEDVDQSVESENLLALSLIENYYMANSCFLEEGQLLENAELLEGIPCTIVNGRLDMCCPPLTAYKLHMVLPGSKLVLIEDGGHGGWPVMKVVIQEMMAFE